jgi:hypothetical protein
MPQSVACPPVAPRGIVASLLFVTVAPAQHTATPHSRARKIKFHERRRWQASGRHRVFDLLDELLERERLGQKIELASVCRKMFLERIFGVS